MSWHNRAILIHSDFGDDARELFTLLGVGNANRRTDWDTVLGGGADSFTGGEGGVGIISCDDWTSIFGFGISAELMESRMPLLASRADLLVWELEGSCGYAAYQWWKNGVKVRHWEGMEGRIVRNEGSPQFTGDELAPAGIDHEDRVFRAMAALAVPLEKLWDQPLIAYECTPAKSRSWWRRLIGI